MLKTEATFSVESSIGIYVLLRLHVGILGFIHKEGWWILDCSFFGLHSKSESRPNKFKKTRAPRLAIKKTEPSALKVDCYEDGERLMMHVSKRY